MRSLIPAQTDLSFIKPKPRCGRVFDARLYKLSAILRFVRPMRAAPTTQQDLHVLLLARAPRKRGEYLTDKDFRVFYWCFLSVRY